MKNILCPTDFSPTADQAIAYAAKLSKKIGAELTLLNVQSIFSLPLAEVIKGKFLATDPISQQLEDKSYQVMNEFKITCHSEVEPSNRSLTDIITDRSKDFDLIVMGTNGADDYYKFLIGTNSYLVARDSSIPLLLIPNGCGYNDITKIVLAYDYCHEPKLPLTQLVRWVELLKASVTVLEVNKQYAHNDEVKAAEIQQRIISQNPALEIQFDTIYSDELIDGIDSYVLNTEADVLALCSMNPTIIQTAFHKSVIKTLSATAHYPLFIFHK